jgi:MraZ protein
MHVGQSGKYHNVRQVSRMLIGEYRHTLDGKRRIALPAKFRQALGRKVVITRGLDACLFVFSTTQWRSIVEKLNRLSMGQADSRAFGRYLFAGAAEVEVDALGRILVPSELAAHAKLASRTVLIGVNDRCEIWDETAWDAYRVSVEKEADRVAEKLGDIGVL